MPQKSACFHSFEGWSWHWVHWICWPRNSRVVSEVERDRPELEVGQDVVDRAVLLVRALGRDQVVDDLVPGPVRRELLAQPARQGRAVDHPSLVAPADQQDGPLGREVLGVVGVLEQVLDQLLAACPAPWSCRKARASWTLGIRPSRSR